MQQVNVLIIDDSEIDRYILHRQLKEAGVTHVEERDDGSTGLDFLRSCKSEQQNGCPQIIFLDINMPHINGFEFLNHFSEIRKQDEICSCVVMMYSSSERTEDKEQAYKHDFVKDFVIKGETTADTLKQKILSHVN